MHREIEMRRLKVGNRAGLVPTVLATLVLAFGQAGLSLRADAAVPDALDASIREWMALNHLGKAGLAVMKAGKLAKSFDHGGWTADQPQVIASLSKAITAVCIARLIDQGRLSFTTNLGQVLGKQFQALGEPVDPRFKTITIEQLLTHRSGLARDSGAVDTAIGMTDLFASVLRLRLAAAPGGAMSYSNIGYLTLGIVVEAVTGSDYESYCRRTVLEPLGVAGSIDPDERPGAPVGGWLVSAIDYARFAQLFSPGATLLGPVSRAWLDSRTGYALGVFIRRTATGVVLWHEGKMGTPPVGSYFVKFDNGWTVVLIYSGIVSGDASQDLARRVAKAAGRG
jgi:CubicO group peptidase (beta-lactamase class C family)